MTVSVPAAPDILSPEHARDPIHTDALVASLEHEGIIALD